MSDTTAEAIIGLRQFITEQIPRWDARSMGLRLGQLETLQRAVEANERPISPPEEGTIVETINAAWGYAEDCRTAMFNHGLQLEALDRKARFDLGEEWYKARSGDIRQAMIEEYWKDEVAYAECKGDYDRARHNFRLAMMEVERLRMVAAL